MPIRRARLRQGEVTIAAGLGFGGLFDSPLAAPDLGDFFVLATTGV